MNIAMWSGPRNLSTAMMYSFGNRRDFRVVDEPFYASYLRLTGLEHPMRSEILADDDASPAEVSRSLLETDNGANPHLYQKHMTQHMVEGIPRDWMACVRNVFLIRHPARVLASWTNKHDVLRLVDTGFVQQAELFDALSTGGAHPIVIDSADIRDNPEGMLRGLCAQLELDWDPAMLCWPSGGHESDGVWAAHWYDAVHRSTGFAGAEGPLPNLTGELARLNEKALPLFERLAAHKFVA